jgi:hypothetical protein
LLQTRYSAVDLTARRVSEQPKEGAAHLDWSDKISARRIQSRNERGEGTGGKKWRTSERMGNWRKTFGGRFSDKEMGFSAPASAVYVLDSTYLILPAIDRRHDDVDMLIRVSLLQPLDLLKGKCGSADLC